MSCKARSIDELDKTIPVNPPKVNRTINPQAHLKDGVIVLKFAPERVLSQLKILTPVGTAIIIVADVK